MFGKKTLFAAATLAVLSVPGVGSASAANYATAFRERFGMPPSGFRELGASGALRGMPQNPPVTDVPGTSTTP